MIWHFQCIRLISIKFQVKFFQLKDVYFNQDILLNHFMPLKFNQSQVKSLLDLLIYFYFCIQHNPFFIMHSSLDLSLILA